MKKAIRTLFLISISTLSLHAQNVMEKAKELGHAGFYQMVMASKQLSAAATAEVGAENSLAPFTVLVPTNEALGKVKDLDKEILKDMVKLLVVPGKQVKTTKELENETVPTVAGELLAAKDGRIGIEGEEQTVAIIDGPHEASNGTVFVIDELIRPIGMEAPEAPEAPKTERDGQSTQEKSSPATKEVKEKTKAPSEEPALTTAVHSLVEQVKALKSGMMTPQQPAAHHIIVDQATPLSTSVQSLADSIDKLADAIDQNPSEDNAHDEEESDAQEDEDDEESGPTYAARPRVIYLGE